MDFSYNTWLATHWDYLARMLLENYWTPENNDSTIILGTYVHQPVSFFRQTVKNRLIIYQTEPLIENHWWKIDHIVNNIRGADEIWDYDLQNIEVLRSHGIEAKFRPPLYTEGQRRVNNVENPDIDVLFYGTFTEYRSKMIYQCVNDAFIPGHQYNMANKLNIMTLFNFTGEQLDEYIGRSKIILNIGPYAGNRRQEQTRIYYALTNGKCVLSERASVNNYDDMILEFNGPQELSEKMLDLLIDDKWRNHTNQDFKSFSQTLRQKYNI